MVSILLQKSTNTQVSRPALLLFTVLAALNILGAVWLIPDRGGDFQTFYRGADSWRQGGSFYAHVAGVPGNLNHPVMLTVFLPFTLLSPTLAPLCWTLLSLAVAVWCATVAQRTTSLQAWQAFLIIVASNGAAVGLGFAQVTFFFAIIFTAAWLADRRGNQTGAGAALGLLLTLKPFFGLFGLYLLWRRQWRAIGVAIATGIATTALGVLLVGGEGYAEWWANLADVHWLWHVYNASIWGVGSRLFTTTDTPLAAAWTPVLLHAALARAIGLIGAVGTLSTVWRRRSNDIDGSYAVIGLACILMSPLGWIYYMPTCGVPILAVLSRSRTVEHRWPLAALAFVPFPLLVNEHYGVMGTLLAGQVAFGAALGVWLLVLRGTPAGEIQSLAGDQTRKFEAVCC